MKIELDNEQSTQYDHIYEISWETAQAIFEDPEALVISGPKTPKKKDTFFIKAYLKDLKCEVICHYKRTVRRVAAVISLRRFTDDLASKFDFSEATKNPYIEPKKEQLTIRLDPEALEYFMNLAKEKNEKYQTLINKYLLFCAQTGFNLPASWEPPKKNIR